MGWKVTPEWRGQTAFIIAGGPSVSGEDLTLIKGRKVVVVNSSYSVYPDADFLIFADARWYNRNGEDVRKTFKGRVVSLSKQIGDRSVLHLGRVKPSATSKAITDDRSKLVIERTTLQSAINLCVHLGCTRIVLIGADMGRGPKGETHHHAPHPWKNKDGNKTWDLQMEHLKAMAEPLRKLGVDVINASLNSRIDWWNKAPLSEAVKFPNKPRRLVAVGTPDSREYDRLKSRGFKPYSKGHQVMYTKPIETVLAGSQHRIFEAGFGIGFGLDQMVKANVISRFVGVEPNRDSYDYTLSRHPGMELLHSPFTPDLADQFSGQFDHAFCIEVIEHVPLEDHLQFLGGLRRLAPKLWFSTPDINKVPREGVRTTEEWEGMLYDAGFGKVVVDKTQWTYLYECS